MSWFWKHINPYASVIMILVGVTLAACTQNSTQNSSEFSQGESQGESQETLQQIAQTDSLKEPQKDSQKDSQKELQSDSSPQTETKESVSAKEESNASVSPSQEDWKPAFEEATRLVQAGNIQKASYFFSNALGKDPGNMTVIKGYRSAIQKYIDESEDFEIKCGYLIALETFLQGQIVHVPTENLNELVLYLQNIAEQRAALDNSAQEFEIEDVSEVQDGNLESSEELESFTALKQSLTEQCGYVEKSVEAEYLDIASYQLQECEQLMRGLIALQPKLAPEYQKEVAEIYDNLKQLGGRVVDKKSELVWKAFLTADAAFQKSLSEAKPTQSEGVNQQKISLIQKRRAELQKIMPQLSEKFLGDVAQPDASSNTAVAHMQKLQKLLENAAEKQQQAYNSWALGEIKVCLDEAKGGVGTFTNGEEGRTIIGKALIEHLGPIDQRLLTNEVARCFQEVQGKFLADNQLNPPKTSADFNEPGTKLHTLKGLYEKPKKPLSQF